MKSTMTQSIVLKNNRDILIQSDIEPYQLYVNQYYIEHELSDAVKITKHYYMGAQKIASDAGFGPPRIVDPNFFTGVVLDNLNDALDVLDKAPIDLPLDGPLETVEDLFGELRQFEVSTITLPAQTRPRLLYWYHPDYIGNVDLITDADGEAYQFFMYNAWGENLYDWQSNTGDYNSPYRFNGKELDPETGNYYYGARYYDPKISVWLSVDPLAHKYPSHSPFNNSLNNPVMLHDPNGMWVEGAGFFNNLLFSDAKSKAKMIGREAKENGAYDVHVNKNDQGGWTVSYQSGEINERNGGLNVDLAEMTLVDVDANFKGYFDSFIDMVDYKFNAWQDRNMRSSLSTWGKIGDYGDNVIGPEIGFWLGELTETFNPVFVIPNAATILITGKDLYGEKTSGMDKVGAAVDIGELMPKVAKRIPFVGPAFDAIDIYGAAKERYSNKPQ